MMVHNSAFRLYIYMQPEAGGGGREEVAAPVLFWRALAVGGPLLALACCTPAPHWLYPARFCGWEWLGVGVEQAKHGKHACMGSSEANHQPNQHEVLSSIGINDESQRLSRLRAPVGPTCHLFRQRQAGRGSRRRPMS